MNYSPAEREPLVLRGGLSTFKVQIMHSSRSSSHLALIDSRAIGNFIDVQTAQKLQMPLLILQHPSSIQATHRNKIGLYIILLLLH